MGKKEQECQMWHSCWDMSVWTKVAERWMDYIAISRTMLVTWITLCKRENPPVFLRLLPKQSLSIKTENPKMFSTLKVKEWVLPNNFCKNDGNSQSIQTVSFHELAFPPVVMTCLPVEKTLQPTEGMFLPGEMTFVATATCFHLSVWNSYPFR